MKNKNYNKEYFYNSKLRFLCENEEVEKQLLTISKMGKSLIDLPKGYVTTRQHIDWRPSTLNMERNLAIFRLIMFYVITDKTDKLLNLIQYYWQEIDTAIKCCDKFNKPLIKKEIEKNNNLVDVRRNHIKHLLYILNETLEDHEDFIFLLKNKYPEFNPSLLIDDVIKSDNFELYCALKEYEMELHNFSFSMDIHTMEYYKKYDMKQKVILKYNLIQQESKVVGISFHHIYEYTEDYNPLEEDVLFELIYLKNEKKGLCDLTFLHEKENENEKKEGAEVDENIFDLLYDEILKTSNEGTKTFDKRKYQEMLLTVERTQYNPLSICHLNYDFNRYLLSEEKLVEIFKKNKK